MKKQTKIKTQKNKQTKTKQIKWYECYYCFQTWSVLLENKTTGIIVNTKQQVSLFFCFITLYCVTQVLIYWYIILVKHTFIELQTFNMAHIVIRLTNKARNVFSTKLIHRMLCDLDCNGLADYQCTGKGKTTNDVSLFIKSKEQLLALVLQIWFRCFTFKAP